jgi:hypothetical protein
MSVCFFSFVLSPIARSFVKLLFVFGRFVFAMSDESWMLMLLEGCVSFFGVFFGGVAERRRRSRGGDF